MPHVLVHPARPPHWPWATLHHPTGAAWAALGKALGPGDLDSGFSCLLAMTLEMATLKMAP